MNSLWGGKVLNLSVIQLLFLWSTGAGVESGGMDGEREAVVEIKIKLAPSTLYRR